MRIPPRGYLTLALLCGELLCVIAWAFTGIFFILDFSHFGSKGVGYALVTDLG
jgi:hypothetical protein